jgi:hypothetical protein
VDLGSKAVGRVALIGAIEGKAKISGGHKEEARESAVLRDGTQGGLVTYNVSKLFWLLAAPTSVKTIYVVSRLSQDYPKARLTFCGAGRPKLMKTARRVRRRLQSTKDDIRDFGYELIAQS